MTPGEIRGFSVSLSKIFQNDLTLENLDIVPVSKVKMADNLFVYVI